MQITWKPTHHHYHAIIAAPDVATKQALYDKYFVQPWQAMIGMMQGMMQTEDALSTVRAWGWPLPEDLHSVPAALAVLEAADAWEIGEAALYQAVAAFDGYNLPFDTVEGWLMIGVPERVNPVGGGYNGTVDWTSPRFICQYHLPDERNLRALPGAVVHEFNHLIRLRAFPWDMQNTSVADYIIHEGMAESSATALFGEDVLGYYVTDISQDDLQTARDLIGQNLEVTGFDRIRGFIFGDQIAGNYGFAQVGMPDFGGYAVGYHIVQAYLQRTGATITDATFTPAMQIVRESGYFL